MALAFADEGTQRFAGTVAAQTVQVQLSLDVPLALPQLAHHIRADAGLAVAQGFIGFQQGGDVEGIAQGFLQHGLMVAFALNRAWRSGFAAQAQLTRQPPLKTGGAYIKPFAEIERNGFDLNIGRYLKTAVADEIDLPAALLAYQEARAARIASEQAMFQRLAAAGIADLEDWGGDE